MGGQNFRSPGIPQLPYFPGTQQQSLYGSPFGPSQPQPMPIPMPMMGNAPTSNIVGTVDVSVSLIFMLFSFM
jgi:hypothetical protein